MVEFAFSGVGNNPHFGTPAAWDGRYNQPAGQGDHVPGGSSSGAAVSVATGAAFIGLGSDTGGSIRVPAALNGIVGFKNTARATPTQGVLPLSTTLDTVCAMTRSVEDCLTVDAVLSGAALRVRRRPLRGMRLAVPQTLLLDALAPEVAAAFSRALSTLSAAGAQILDIPLAELAEISRLNAPGGFSAV